LNSAFLGMNRSLEAHAIRRIEWGCVHNTIILSKMAAVKVKKLLDYNNLDLHITFQVHDLERTIVALDRLALIDRNLGRGGVFLPSRRRFVVPTIGRTGTDVEHAGG
jgi:hypothetical protein